MQTMDHTFVDGTIEWSHNTGVHFEEPVQKAAE